jgi:hypothetical protein
LALAAALPRSTRPRSIAFAAAKSEKQPKVRSAKIGSGSLVRRHGELLLVPEDRTDRAREVSRGVYRTLKYAKVEVSHHIERFYNLTCRHSVLAYLSP